VAKREMGVREGRRGTEKKRKKEEREGRKRRGAARATAIPYYGVVLGK
jgi:hypothetical protein